MTDKEKKDIIRGNSGGALTWIVGGKRFARCTVCGREWNIPLYWDARRTSNYVCPVCDGRRKNEVRKDG